MTTRRRWTAIVAGGAVLVLVASIIVALVSSHSTAGDRVARAPTTTPAATAPASAPATTSPTTGPAPTVASAPEPGDVAAARACQAFSVYLADAQKGTIPRAVGSRLVTASGVLLRGSRAAAAAGRALPKWAELGSALLAAAADVVNHDSKALATDGAAADAACQRVPANAATAGGYHRGG